MLNMKDCSETSKAIMLRSYFLFILLSIYLLTDLR